MPKLGTMTKDDIKGVWGDERAFCKWLANDGLPVLNSVLMLSLEDAEEQVTVGRYAADIVCTDMSDYDRPAKAVIEVQRGVSDHDHLGKVLAYAAGLDDADPELKHVLRHIVWIAEEFTDEHSRALEWMNGYFGPSVYFFGIVAQVKRIDDSDPAIEFVATSMPHNWTRTGGIIVDPGPLPPLPQEHLDFWTQFVEGFPSHMSNLSTRKPGAFHFMDFAIGFGSNAHLSVNRIKTQGLIRLRIVLGNSSLSGWFGALNNQKDEIENDLQLLDGELEWRAKEGADASVIQVVSRADTSDRSDWPRQMQWMYEHLEKFDRVFRKRLPPN